MSEAEIIKKLQLGDENVFRELVDNYRQMVVNTCFGLLHNKEDAEDVAQDVFIEILRSAESFRGDSKISTWIYRIAVNRSLNFLRDNKRRRWFQSFDDTVQSKQNNFKDLRSQNSDNPGFDLENSERSAILHAAIDALPKNQKIAFTLNKYEDLTYREISEVMQLSVSSVESLIHRAKKNLQKKLYYCYKKKCI
ncbi:MAG: RNA polymerase sigma factor [Prolixibacteraceae bacterium]|nr:RNA polymerase sigma factor [Prolixibacteraceae bacterium]